MTTAANDIAESEKTDFVVDGDNEKHERKPGIFLHRSHCVFIVVVALLAIVGAGVLVYFIMKKPAKASKCAVTSEVKGGSGVSENPDWALCQKTVAAMGLCVIDCSALKHMTNKPQPSRKPDCTSQPTNTTRTTGPESRRSTGHAQRSTTNRDRRSTTKRNGTGSTQRSSTPMCRCDCGNATTSISRTTTSPGSTTPRGPTASPDTTHGPTPSTAPSPTVHTASSTSAQTTATTRASNTPRGPTVSSTPGTTASPSTTGSPNPTTTATRTKSSGPITTPVSTATTPTPTTTISILTPSLTTTTPPTPTPTKSSVPVTTPVSTTAPSTSTTNTSTLTPSTTSTPPATNAPYPKDIRLPEDLVPVDYELTLQPNIYGKDPKAFTFDGQVVILITCKVMTDKIVLHSRQLTYDNDSMSLTNPVLGNAPNIVLYTFDLEREFLILHLDGNLTEGSIYLLNMTFSGPLKEDLRGLYLSSYKRDNRTVLVHIHYV